MRKAFIQLHVAIFLAGFTGILGRLITLNEGLLVWYRLLITSITLWVLYYYRKKIRRIAVTDMMKIFGAGTIAALHWVTFYGSIKYANVSIALVCFSAIGFFTALFEPLILKKRMSILEVLLSLVAIAGIYLVFHFDPKYKTGIIIGLISAILGSLFPILNRKFLKTFSAETVMLYELTGGFLFLSLLLPFYNNRFPSDHLIPGWTDFGWLLVLSWLCTVIAFHYSMNALKKISAFTVNLSYNLEPLYGIFLAFAVFREDKLLTHGFYLGLLLIVISVMMQSMRVYWSNRNLKI